MIFPPFFPAPATALRLQLVSRLDLPTSGVLPLARDAAAAELLRAQFTAGLVEKAGGKRGVPWGPGGMGLGPVKHGDFTEFN